MTVPAPARLLAGPGMISPGSVAGWGVAVAFWLYYLTPFLTPTHRSWTLAVITAVAGAVGVGALALRHRSIPLVVLVVGCTVVLSPAAIGAAFVVQAASARRWGRLSAVLLTGGWLVLAKFVQLLAGPGHSEWTLVSAVEATIAVGGLVVATLVGWLSRSISAERVWRADAQAARRDADEARLDQARLQERERIAREMHDALAHRISLVAMHAGALAYRDDLDTATVRETAQLIQRNARLAGDELRLVLSRLREPGTAPEPPQPTLRELPVLVAEARDSGTEIHLELDAAGVTGLPPALSRAAYRIVQEGLTNARKHAPGAPVDVRVAANDELVLAVSNPLGRNRGGDGGSRGPRLGLIGIAERAELLGGTVATGAVDGRFTLEVRIPRDTR